MARGEFNFDFDGLVTGLCMAIGRGANWFFGGLSYAFLWRLNFTVTISEREPFACAVFYGFVRMFTGYIHCISC